MRKKNRHKPILVIDNLPVSFGSDSQRNLKKRDYQIGKDEKILLTLIANIIVEIALKDEL